MRQQTCTWYLCWKHKPSSGWTLTDSRRGWGNADRSWDCTAVCSFCFLDSKSSFFHLVKPKRNKQGWGCSSACSITSTAKKRKKEEKGQLTLNPNHHTPTSWDTVNKWCSPSRLWNPFQFCETDHYGIWKLSYHSENHKKTSKPVLMR
jgi:hypothetical protein